jgi:hypothetical protein
MRELPTPEGKPMTEQELRAWSLEIAVLMLGRIPKAAEVDEKLDPHRDTANLDSNEAYADYLRLAKRIERYVKNGCSLP